MFHTLCPIAYQDETGFHYGTPEFKTPIFAQAKTDQSSKPEIGSVGQPSSQPSAVAIAKQHRLRTFRFLTVPRIFRSSGCKLKPPFRRTSKPTL
jgi:hypothetical protein